MSGVRSRWPVRRARLVAIALALVVVVLGAACGGDKPGAGAGASPSARATAVSLPFPSTPAGEQLGWVVGRMNQTALLTQAEVKTHFSREFLAQVPVGDLIVALSQVAQSGPLRLVAVLDSSSATSLIGQLDGPGGASLKTTIVVDPATGRIEGLLFQPYKPVTPPSSWSEIDGRLAELASQASLVAVEVGSEAPVHAREAERVGAIGSAFKLYVLGALAAAIDEGSASWQESLAVREAWKSLPSGDMRMEPAGRRFTLRHYAEQMIATSDNTATDHLMRRLGRSAVEDQLEPMGLSARGNRPFLTTREMFVLKLNAPDALRQAYVAAGPADRRRLLARVDRLPVSLDDAAGWIAPRDIDTLEWFASPVDLAEALLYLHETARRPGLAPVRSILARNPGILLDAGTWRSAAFKGGSEPGVLSLAWLLERRDGRTFALAIVLNDSVHDIDQAAAVALAEGAVGLLAAVP